jgi:hypothetical protein
MEKEVCELLEKAKKLPFNRDKDLICPMVVTCKKKICLYLSDVDQLEVEQLDLKYIGGLPDNDTRVV